MVLADDNFASIVAAIEEGRGVFDNIRKFVTYILASNVPELVPFLAFVLLHVPLPLTVMQILAVDLGTDLLPALALGMEPPEPGGMDRPPRPRSERLVTPAVLARAYGWLGAIEAALALGAFFLTFWLAGWRGEGPLPDAGPLYVLATTMSLAGIVASQVGNVFACRSRSASTLAIGFTSNRAILVGVLAEIVLLAALVYVPPLAGVFGLAPLQPVHWLVLTAFGPALLLLEELRKAWRRRTGSVPPLVQPAWG